MSFNSEPSDPFPHLAGEPERGRTSLAFKALIDKSAGGWVVVGTAWPRGGWVGVGTARTGRYGSEQETKGTRTEGTPPVNVKSRCVRIIGS